jgi:hypothetical protein
MAGRVGYKKGDIPSENALMVVKNFDGTYSFTYNVTVWLQKMKDAGTIEDIFVGL